MKDKKSRQSGKLKAINPTKHLHRLTTLTEPESTVYDYHPVNMHEQSGAKVK